MERTIAASFAIQETQVVDQAPVDPNAPELQAANVDAEQLLGIPQEQGFFNFPKVRDITELVLSVVENEFPARGVEVLGSKTIVRSLRDLMEFLRERLSGALEGVQPVDAETATSETPAPAP